MPKNGLIGTLEGALQILSLLPHKGPGLSTQRILTRLESDFGIDITLRNLQKRMAELHHGGYLDRVADGRSYRWRVSPELSSQALCADSTDELLALALVDQHQAALPPDALAIFKVRLDRARDMLKARRDDARARFVNKIVVRQSAWAPVAPTVSVDVVEKTKTALMSESVLQVRYADGVSEERSLLLSGYGLLIQDGIHRLLATPLGSDCLQWWRLDYMVSAHLVDRDSAVPPGFNFLDWLQSQGARSLNVLLRVNEAGVRLLTRAPLSENQTITSTADRGWNVTATVPSIGIDEFCCFLLRHVAEIQLIDADDGGTLRQKLIEMLRVGVRTYLSVRDGTLVAAA